MKNFIEENLLTEDGFSKLFKHCNLNNIITYCDLRLFTGTVYSNAGFTYLYNSRPNYFYIKNRTIISRESAQKHKLNKFLENFDDTLSETKNMHNNGWNKVYNCGNSVWAYHK